LQDYQQLQHQSNPLLGLHHDSAAVNSDDDDKSSKFKEKKM